MAGSEMDLETAKELVPLSIANLKKWNAICAHLHGQASHEKHGGTSEDTARTTATLRETPDVMSKKHERSYVKELEAAFAPSLGPFHITEAPIATFTNETASSAVSMYSATRGSAGVRVSNTYELLEQILVQQDFMDLVHWQRVTRQWREVIASSQPLQQKMFLRPEPEGPTLGLLRTAHGTFFLFPLTKADSSWQYAAKVVTLHPALEDVRCLTSPETCGIDCSLSAGIVENIFFSGASDSLRNMFLTQPPAKHVRYYNHWKLRGHVFSGAEIVQNSHGVRFGDIIDLIHQKVERAENMIREISQQERANYLVEAPEPQVRRAHEQKLELGRLECYMSGLVSPRPTQVKASVHKIKRRIKGSKEA